MSDNEGLPLCSVCQRPVPPDNRTDRWDEFGNEAPVEHARCDPPLTPHYATREGASAPSGA